MTGLCSQDVQQGQGLGRRRRDLARQVVAVTLGLGLGWWRNHSASAEQVQLVTDRLTRTHEDTLKFKHVLRQLEQIYEKETGNEVGVSWPGEVIIQPPEPAEP